MRAPMKRMQSIGAKFTVFVDMLNTSRKHRWGKGSSGVKSSSPAYSLSNHFAVLQ